MIATYAAMDRNKNTADSAGGRRSVGRREIPRLLSGIGAYGAASLICESAARAWPGTAPGLLAGLLLVGLVCLAILVLRTCETTSLGVAAPFDRLMIRFSGPLSIIILVLSVAFGFASIEQVKGTNRFRSLACQDAFVGLMAAGFVLALCSLVSRRGTHVPPHVCWRVIAVPLVLIFGMYVLLTPISCAAARYGVS